MSGLGEFKPDEHILSDLLAMGITRRVAEVALYNTGNHSCDAAIAYVFDSKECTQSKIQKRRAIREARRENEKKIKGDGKREKEENESYKMVFVVNTTLGMSCGKIAAQVGHAAIGLYKEILADDDLQEIVDMWQSMGEKKIVVKGLNVHHLLQLEELAENKGLPTYLVQDAGYTEIPPDSITILGIFGDELYVNEVTGDLDLL